MTTIVQYECGCIGIPAVDGTAAILVACDSSDEPGPGRIDRPMEDKKYEPIDFTKETYQAFLAEEELRRLRRAMREIAASFQSGTVSPR